jgi:hypothetical protein
MKKTLYIKVGGVELSFSGWGLRDVITLIANIKFDELPQIKESKIGFQEDEE